MIVDHKTVASASGGTRATDVTPTDGDYHFPVLSSMLETYFATDRADLFFDKYAREGENSVEFEGLQDDLKAAIRSPRRAAAEINPLLGTDLEPAVLREQLVEVYEQITSTGAFDPITAQVRQAGEESLRPTPQETFAAYATRRVALPSWAGPLSRPIPLWALLVAGMALAGLVAAADALGAPDWANPLVAVLSALSLLLIGFSALAMILLRNDVKTQGKERIEHYRKVTSNVPLTDERNAEKEQQAKKSGGFLSSLNPLSRL